MLATVVILFAVSFLDESWWCCPDNHLILDAILFWCWYLALAALVCQLIAFIMALIETICLKR